MICIVYMDIYIYIHIIHIYIYKKIHFFNIVVAEIWFKPEARK